jgi:hypothetical protein
MFKERCWCTYCVEKLHSIWGQPCEDNLVRVTSGCVSIHCLLYNTHTHSCHNTHTHSCHNTHTLHAIIQTHTHSGHNTEVCDHTPQITWLSHAHLQIAAKSKNASTSFPDHTPCTIRNSQKASGMCTEADCNTHILNSHRSGEHVFEGSIPRSSRALPS